MLLEFQFKYLMLNTARVVVGELRSNYKPVKYNTNVAISLCVQVRNTPNLLDKICATAKWCLVIWLSCIGCRQLDQKEKSVFFVCFSEVGPLLRKFNVHYAYLLNATLSSIHYLFLSLLLRLLYRFTPGCTDWPVV